MAISFFNLSGKPLALWRCLKEALNESILDSSERAAVKMRFSPCFKINDVSHRFWRHIPVPHGISDSIRDSLKKDLTHALSAK